MFPLGEATREGHRDNAHPRSHLPQQSGPRDHATVILVQTILLNSVLARSVPGAARRATRVLGRRKENGRDKPGHFNPSDFGIGLGPRYCAKQ
jgi:hypothetical protein